MQFKNKIRLQYLMIYIQTHTSIFSTFTLFDLFVNKHTYVILRDKNNGVIRIFLEKLSFKDKAF